MPKITTLALKFIFTFQAQAGLELSVEKIIKQEDHFSLAKKGLEPLMKIPYDLYRKRKYLECYKKTQELIEDSKYKFFIEDLKSLMITCYVSTPRKKRPELNIGYDFFKSAAVIKKIFRDIGFDKIREIVKASKIDIDNWELVKYLSKNPSSLCFFHENKAFSAYVLNAIPEREDFYSLSFSRLPCDLELPKSFDGLLEDKKTYSLYRKKGSSTLKERPEIKFKRIKSKISKNEYRKFRRLNTVRSKKFIKDLEGMPSYILNRISKNLFYRSKYIMLSEFRKHKRPPLETLSYVIKAAIAEGEQEIVMELTKSIDYSKSQWAEEILLMRGGVFLRQEKFDLAEKEFSKMLEHSVDLKLSALYWKWVSLIKLNKKSKAKKISKKILTAYPFSYFGLTVAQHYEGKNFFDKYINKYNNFQIKFRSLCQSDVDRLTEYYSLGWLKAFRAVYSEVEPKLNSREKGVFALVFYNLGETRETIRILNDEWDNDSALRAQPFISTSFSFQYSDEITKVLEKNKNISSAIVRAIIRQESAFQAKAKSASGAKGLMQLMNPTAREIARQLRIRKFNPNRSLYKPNINIRLGSRYMNRLINANNGYLPYAFASYNAGPGKMNRWSSKRQEIYDLKKEAKRDQKEITEFWIEELPWVETRFYAKALLRNMGIYMALSGQKNSFECNPYWTCSQTSEDIEKASQEK